MRNTPTYLSEVAEYIEDKLDDPVALTAALAALLGDPETYVSIKGRPLDAFTGFVHELLLRDRTLGNFIRDPETPVSRALIDGKWCADWRGLRKLSFRESTATPEYDVCISYAGEDRVVAERIANLIKRNRMKRKVFYDDFEKVTIWGEELSRYLHKIYSEQSKFCLILFSHAYDRKAWTRHEFRAALTRVVREQGSYVLPVALDAATVPDELTSVGYWPFKSGDERQIAKAVEEKINDYIRRYYVSLDEIVEIINRNTSASVVVDGIQAGIRKRIDAKDSSSAQALTVLALVAATDTEHIDPSVRAIIDLVLFAPGPVGDVFENDSVNVIGTASLRRWLGANGPFLLSSSGWEEYIEPYKQRQEELESQSEDSEFHSDDED